MRVTKCLLLWLRMALPPGRLFSALTSPLSTYGRCGTETTEGTFGPGDKLGLHRRDVVRRPSGRQWLPLQ